jgi:hypothetical protein
VHELAHKRGCRWRIASRFCFFFNANSRSRGVALTFAAVMGDGRARRLYAIFISLDNKGDDGLRPRHTLAWVEADGQNHLYGNQQTFALFQRTPDNLNDSLFNRIQGHSNARSRPSTFRWCSAAWT